MSNFEITLRELQRRLKVDNRLGNYRTVWCQGSNKPHVTLLVTLFDDNGYTMKFIPFKNFANFKKDSENQTAFENQLESIIGQLV
jgi:hypothetical protein